MTTLTPVAERAADSGAAAVTVNYAAALTREQWPQYLAGLSRRDDLACRVEVVVGRRRRNADDARMLPRSSIDYEEGDGRIVVRLRDGTDVLTHAVDRPRLVEVVGRDDRPLRIDIIDVKGTRTRLSFASS